MVGVLACFSDDSVSNTSEGYSFSVKFCFKRTNINKKIPGWAHFIKNSVDVVVDREEKETLR